MKTFYLEFWFKTAMGTEFKFIRSMCVAHNSAMEAWQWGVDKCKTLKQEILNKIPGEDDCEVACRNFALME